MSRLCSSLHFIEVPVSGPWDALETVRGVDTTGGKVRSVWERHGLSGGLVEHVWGLGRGVTQMLMAWHQICHEVTVSSTT